MKALSHEETRGTKTYHLPFSGPNSGPLQATLVVERTGANTYEAGLAVCGPKDTFNRRLGRRIAFGRLQSAQFEVTTVEELREKLEEKLQHVSGAASPNYVRARREVLRDISRICINLQNAFDRLDQNRPIKLSQKAQTLPDMRKLFSKRFRSFLEGW